jgi:hypothetical protein
MSSNIAPFGVLWQLQVGTRSRVSPRDGYLAVHRLEWSSPSPGLDPHMARQDDTKRPLPSADEINAYLELSAARTKKRLTLAFGTTGAPKLPARDRKLPVAGAPKAELTRELSPIAELAPSAAEPSKAKPSGG